MAVDITWCEHFPAQNKYLFPTGEAGNSQTWLCWVVNPSEKAVCLKLCHHTQISDGRLNLLDRTFFKITLPASLQQRLGQRCMYAPPPTSTNVVTQWEDSSLLMREFCILQILICCVFIFTQSQHIFYFALGSPLWPKYYLKVCSRYFHSIDL